MPQIVSVLLSFEEGCDIPKLMLLITFNDKRPLHFQIGRASCRGKSVDLGGRRIIKKKKRKEKKKKKKEKKK